MSGTSPAVRANEVLDAGAIRAIPGRVSGAYRADQPPFVVQSGRLTFAGTSSGTKNAGTWVAPFDGEIIALVIKKITADASTKAHPFNVGTAADPDAFVDAYDAKMATGEAAYEEVNLATAAVVETNFSKGDVIEFKLDPTATSVGTAVCAASLVVVPRLAV